MRRFTKYFRNQIFIIFFLLAGTIYAWKGSTPNMDSQSVNGIPGSAPVPDTINITDKKQDFSVSGKPPEDFSVVNSFNNELRNSRSAVTLGKNLWNEKWKVPLDEGLTPRYILYSSDMIIVYGDGNWQLFNMDGKSVNSGATGFSEIYLDKKNGLFYFSDANGLVQVRNLRDGNHKFSLFPMFGAEYSRQAFYRNGRLLDVLSVEEMEDPHGNHIRNSSVMEAVDIGEPETIDSNGYLLSAHRINSIPVSSVDVYAVFDNKTTAITAPGQIIISDSELKSEKVLADDFTPLALSMDTEGRFYLIVRVASDAGTHNAFWVVNREGIRLLNIDLPDDVQNFYPPVIGYGSKLCLLSDKNIYSVDIKNGSVAEIQFEKPLGGAAVSADNKLILAAGSMVYGIDDDGETIYLTHLEDGTWLTNPVFTDNDNFLCASGKFLYCFGRGQKIN